MSHGGRKKRNRDLNLKFNGETIDGKLVLSGYYVFKLVETKGLPLEILLFEIEEQNIEVDWIEFVVTSVQHNWKLQSTLYKIENSLDFIKSKDDIKKIMNILYEIFAKYL